ncbi:hypothetical protein V3C99_016190 [Haemonchus contortus]
MFFILASLALLVPIVFTQGSKSPLSSSGIEGLMDLSRKYEDDLDWSEDLVNKALEWINSPKKAVKADVKVKGKKCFPKEDEEGPVADFEKITSSFTGPFEKQGKKDSCPRRRRLLWMQWICRQEVQGQKVHPCRLSLC